jgi:hypothetical protein
MNQENYEQKVEDYFDRSMSADGRARLQEEAKSNTELAEMLDLGHRIKAAYTVEERQHLKAQLHALEQRGQSGTNWKVWRNIMLAAAAAVALLLIAVPGARYIIFNGNSEAMVEVQFIPYSNIYAAAGGNDDSNERAASDAYQAGKYAEAAQSFGELARQTPDRVEEYMFYQAVSLTGAREYAAALPLLERLAATPDFDFGVAAMGYLAFCQYQTGNKTAAAQSAKAYLAAPALEQGNTWQQVMRQIATSK